MRPMYQYGYDEVVLTRELDKYFNEKKMNEANRALDFATKKHEGQTRVNGQPFIIHPLFVARYGIAIGANTEDQICTALLHDVCEDCDIEPEELPFNDVVKKNVKYLTFKYDFAEEDDDDERKFKKLLVKNKTFAALLECPEALICKCIDRYHNLSTAEELPEKSIRKNVLETHRWLLPAVYSAMTVQRYAQYYDQLYVLSVNLRSLNDHLAYTHEISFNTMS